MRRHLALFLMMLSLTSANAFAKSPVCPTGKEVLGSDIPAGLFAKTAWTLVDFHEDGHDYSDSIFIFSEETVEGEEINVTGYFWWRKDGRIIGCSKLVGDFQTSTRKLFLKTLKASTFEDLSSRIYRATLSADNNTLKGNWTLQNKTVIPNAIIFYMSAGVIWQGTWQARKLDLQQPVDDTNAD